MSGVRSRVLHACLWAFPRQVREKDGGELVSLAAELAAEHGTAREALGLLSGGLGERLRRSRRSRRVALGLATATCSVLVVTAWSAAEQPARAEEERLSCAGDCTDVERHITARMEDGWACAEVRSAPAVTWRCTLD